MKRDVIPVKLGKLVFGSGKIYIQSMLDVPSTDIAGNVRQAVELEKAGCEILRVAVPDKEAVALIPAIKEKISIPLVADIHFDHRLALASAEAGVDKIRLNPGNIGGEENVKKVAEVCRQRQIPIRIGVNSGSVEKDLLEKYGGPTAEALVESGLRHAAMLEKYDFDQIVISLKSTNVPTMVEAYRLLAKRCRYPLHLGVTEAGTERMGLIKSAIGIGSLLLDGIGETIRVSLTTKDLCEEVRAGRDILRSIGLCEGVPELICCPTCGRTRIDLLSLATTVEQRLAGVHKGIKVAVMGCVVNGPGEAREADIGVAGGLGCGVIFKKGEVLRTLPEAELLDGLMAEIEAL